MNPDNVDLISLPTDVWRQVILQYLGIKDLSCLDCAIVRRYHRGLFLSILSHPSCVINGSKLRLEASYFEWILSRGISIRQLHVVDIESVRNLHDGQVSSIEYLRKDYLGEEDCITLVPLIERNSSTITTFISHSIYHFPGLLPAFQNMPHLTHLDMSNSSYILERGICDRIFRHIPQLKVLNLTGCAYNARDLVVSLIENCRNVEEMYFDCNTNQLKDSHLVALAQSYNTQLKSLGLAGSMMLTDIGVCSIGRHCVLTHLSLQDVRNLSQIAFESINSTCLQTLNLSSTGISDVALAKIVKNAEHLTHLNLTECSQVADCTLILLAECCEHLNYLNLTYCFKVSDSGVLAIATGCRDLQVLILDYCQFISENCLQMLAEHKAQSPECLQKLTTLSLACVPSLSDMSVLTSTSLLEDLTEINVSGNPSLTDMSVFHIFCVSIKLQTFKVADCFRITNLCIDKLLYTPIGSLKFLDVSFTHTTLDKVSRVKGVKIRAAHCGFN